MKKQIIILLISVFTFACAAILVIGNDFEISKKITGGESLTTGYQFTLKEYHGKVAVFDYGTAIPFEVLDCPLSSLPEEEAMKLKHGINVVSKSELQQLIEAYD